MYLFVGEGEGIPVTIVGDPVEAVGEIVEPVGKAIPLVGELVKPVGGTVSVVGKLVNLVGAPVPFVVELVGSMVTVGDGARVKEGLPAQLALGSASLLFTASKRGVEKSSIKSPVSSHIRKPFKSLSITYSVFSQMERSLS